MRARRASACVALLASVAGARAGTDVTPPVIVTCAPAVVLAAGPTCAALLPDLTGTVVATDDQGQVHVAQFPPPGVTLGLVAIPVTLTVTDSSGNLVACTASVSVVDATPPTIAGIPGDLVLAARADCRALLPDMLSGFLADDGCGACTFEQAPPAGTALAPGVHEIAFVARDASGNAASASAQVVVTAPDSDGDGLDDCQDPCPLGGTLDLRLDEIQIHQAGLDTREFVEIRGAPGLPLGCVLLLVVDGDGPNAGTLDRAFDLGGFVMPASGRFVLGDEAIVPRDATLAERDGLENGTCTLYLVESDDAGTLASWIGRDLRLGPDATVIPQFARVLDQVGLADADFPERDVVFDGAVVLGPDDALLPAGVFRCDNAPHGWSSGRLTYDGTSASGAAATPASANPACDPGFATCFGDGSGAPCPCANESSPSDRAGCRNSSGKAARLVAHGTASLSADSVSLHVSETTNGPASFFQGTGLDSGGLGSAFGDGLRCASGMLVRLGTAQTSLGTASVPGAGDASISVRGQVVAPTTRAYQVLYRNNAAFCTPAVFNATNAWVVSWVP